MAQVFLFFPSLNNSQPHQSTLELLMVCLPGTGEFFSPLVWSFQVLPLQFLFYFIHNHPVKFFTVLTKIRQSHSPSFSSLLDFFPLSFFITPAIFKFFFFNKASSFILYTSPHRKKKNSQKYNPVG